MHTIGNTLLGNNVLQWSRPETYHEVALGYCSPQRCAVMCCISTLHGAHSMPTQCAHLCFSQAAIDDNNIVTCDIMQVVDESTRHATSPDDSHGFRCAAAARRSNLNGGRLWGRSHEAMRCVAKTVGEICAVTAKSPLEREGQHEGSINDNMCALKTPLRNDLPYLTPTFSGIEHSKQQTSSEDLMVGHFNSCWRQTLGWTVRFLLVPHLDSCAAKESYEVFASSSCQPRPRYGV